MALRITCPTCRESYFVDDDARGQKITCKACKNPLMVPAANQGPSPGKSDPGRSSGKRSGVRPAPTTASIPLAPPVKRRLRDDDVDLPRPAGQPAAAPAGDPGTPRSMVGGAIAVGVVLVAFAGIVWYLSGSRAEKTTAPVVIAVKGEGSPGKSQVPLPEEKNPAEQPDEKSKNSGIQKKPADGGSEALPAKVRERVRRATAYLRAFLPSGGTSIGNGFFAVEKGIVLTNAQVLGMLNPECRPPRRVEVVCYRGERKERSFDAEVVGVDRGSDLAVLRIESEDLPEPLDVKPARNLAGADKVYVFGFEAGTPKGQNLTVCESSVSGFRREPGTEMLQKVQVKGGWQTSHSGGPVLDAQGDVVGLAVAAARAGQVPFAISGEIVHSVLSCHVASLRLGQPFLDSGEVRADVTVQVLDPLRKVRDLAVECWTGDRARARPSSKTQPASESGDADLKKVKLNYDGFGKATGLLTLPPLPAGKVYWLRPVITNVAGETTWGGGSVCEATSPVERKPLQLTLKPKTGVRTLHLTSSTNLQAVTAADRGEHTVAARSDVKVQEQTVPAGPQAFFLNMGYQSAIFDVTIDGKPAPNAERTQTLVQGLGFVITQMIADSNGNVRRNAVLAPRLPTAIKQPTLELHEILFAKLDAVNVPLPGRELAAGTSWTAVRALPIVTGEKADATVLEMNYTYLGMRIRDGKQEAVIDVTGKLKGGRGMEQRYGGNAEGRAVYDVDSGQIVQSQLTVRFDMDEGGSRPVRAAGDVNVRLERQ
jgi:S1-C subfamily serine protease